MSFWQRKKKKKNKIRDVVKPPRPRTHVDFTSFFYRYAKPEQDALAYFNFLRFYPDTDGETIHSANHDLDSPTAVQIQVPEEAVQVVKPKIQRSTALKAPTSKTKPLVRTGSLKDAESALSAQQTHHVFIAGTIDAYAASTEGETRRGNGGIVRAGTIDPCETSTGLANSAEVTANYQSSFADDYHGGINNSKAELRGSHSNARGRQDRKRLGRSKTLDQSGPSRRRLARSRTVNDSSPPPSPLPEPVSINHQPSSNHKQNHVNHKPSNHKPSLNHHPPPNHTRDIRRPLETIPESRKLLTRSSSLKYSKPRSLTRTLSADADKTIPPRTYDWSPKEPKPLQTFFPSDTDDERTKSPKNSPKPQKVSKTPRKSSSKSSSDSESSSTASIEATTTSGSDPTTQLSNPPSLNPPKPQETVRSKKGETELWVRTPKIDMDVEEEVLHKSAAKIRNRQLADDEIYDALERSLQMHSSSDYYGSRESLDDCWVRRRPESVADGETRL